MYDYQFAEMAEAVHEACPEVSIKSVESALRKYWSDKISITWMVSDIKRQARAEGTKITEEQAKHVLQRLLRDHDCEEGTWIFISNMIQEVCRPPIQRG